MSHYGDMMFTESSFHIDEAKDIITVMQLQEATVYRRSDYLSDSKYADVVDGTWRQRIVEWMFGVVDHCSLRRDSVAIAAFYLDLCVERGVVESRQEFQLAAMTALQLAIKLYDSTVVKLDSMIKLGRGLFTEQDVIDMEAKMLNALKWQVHPPTPICFLRQFLRLLPASVTPLARYMVAEVTRFISEISVCLYKFVDCSSSAVAYAGILIAMERLDEATLPQGQRELIFQTMAVAAKLDHRAPLVVEIITRLQASLEKNVSLQDLMNTIDAQCRADGYGVQLAPANDDNNSGDKCSKVRPATGQHHSPRDVVISCQRRE
jgi:hypothetical protein